MSKNQKERPVYKNKNPEDGLPKMLLQQLGLDEWYQDKSKDAFIGDFKPARIVEVNKNNYKVSSGRDEINAELSGKFLFSIESNLDYPTVGDWVAVQYFDQDSHAIIHQLLPRRSVLKRKDPGKKTEFQLIAANIDSALILQSADANFNVNRLERYLIMANQSGIQPIIVLSKTDLLSAAELAEINDHLKPYTKYQFFPISTLTGDGIEALQKVLKKGKTYCLMGSSGVGKTTLLNTLLGEEVLAVNEVREKDKKGRHTTTRRQLICLDSGPIFIDTPGMRELGNFGVESGLEQTFDEIISFSNKCRFKDCTHIHEPGCAVREAVEKGLIEEDRYNNYLKIQKEAAFYEMTYVEKRHKDKEFGKMVKNFKKSQRKK